MQLFAFAGTARRLKNLGTGAARSHISLTIYGLLLAVHSHACFYSPVNFNSSDRKQTNAYDLIYNKYEDEQKRTSLFYAKEIRNLQPQYDARKNDPTIANEYALFCARTGRDKEALQIWQQLLQAQPLNFEALCNSATTLQILGRYEEAKPLLERAAKLKPDLRGGAEKWHLQQLDFQQNVRRDPTYGHSHLFIDELTQVWRARTQPPDSFKKADFRGVTADGIAELLRQFPQFGEGWLVLGMAEEHEGDVHLAKLAYEHAKRTGTGQMEELKNYLPLVDRYLDSQSLAKVVGRAFLRLVILVVGLLIGTKIWNFTQSIRRDRAEAKVARDAGIVVKRKP